MYRSGLYRYFVGTETDCTDIDIQCTETGCTEKTFMYRSGLYRYFVGTETDCTDIDIQCTETGCTEKTCTESVCTEIVLCRKRPTPLYTRYKWLSKRFDNRFDNGFDNRLYLGMYRISGSGSGWPNIRPFFAIRFRFQIRPKYCLLPYSATG